LRKRCSRKWSLVAFKHNLQLCWIKAIEIFKLCSTPASIISPAPFFAISLFLVSNEININNFSIFFSGIVVSLFSSFGSNLWNHCNDIKEDTAQGKKTILTQDISIQRIALFTAILFYLTSILIVFYLSIEIKRPIYIYFLIWSLTTWWYSDNIILKKITGFRLKDHYITELITYGVAWPMYTLSLWLIFSDLNINGLILSVAFFFFGISLLLLKDLKDISGDRKAGLKTLGVVFSPSRLIRFSSILMVFYFIIMLNPLTISVFGKANLILLVPFIYFLKNTYMPMSKKNWKLEIRDIKVIRGIGYSSFASIIFIGLRGFY